MRKTMNSLSYLLGQLDKGAFDCLEYGASHAPGQMAGAIRLRPASAGAYQAFAVEGGGAEVLLQSAIPTQQVGTALERYTKPVSSRHPGARFFGLCLGGSSR
jgi:hypothetical protein